ncbi:MAG: universal stress protein [Verrucomicrobia bacterium]|nr:MAG: universal stress protein [Verrucomicrobiota bacterium]
MITNSDPLSPTASSIRIVLHPSDFSEASLVAFAHALKAALISKSKLVLIHVSDEDETSGTEFPAVRETLERWKLLPPSSPRSAVTELGIDVAKVIGHGSDPVKGVLGYIEQYGADLIVLATHHHGLDWLHKSISEPVARKSREMTLFVPTGSGGFVSLTDGSVSLRNVLIPIAATPPPQPAIVAAVRLIQQLKCESGKFTLLHAGENGSEPAVVTPEVPGWTWHKMTKQGNVIEVILEAARQADADLILMSTDGRNGFLDALRGSHSERVLRHAPCPLLAIPESSHAARCS